MRFYISRDIGRDDQPCDRLAAFDTKSVTFGTSKFVVFDSLEDAMFAAKQIADAHRDQAWDNACHYTIRVIDPIECLPGTNVITPDGEPWVRKTWKTAAYPGQLRLRATDVDMLSRSRPVVFEGFGYYSGRETHDIVDTVAGHRTPEKQPAPFASNKQPSLFQRLVGGLL